MGWETALYAIYIALAAASTYVGVQSANDASEAQEDAAANQALAEKYAAQNVRDEAEEASKRERDNKRRQLARIHAGIAGTSGMVFEGSLEDAFAETAGRMELEIQDGSRARLMQAQNHESAANLASWEGRVQSLATRMDGVGTALSGAGSLAGGIYSGYQNGVFGKKAPATKA